MINMLRALCLLVIIHARPVAAIAQDTAIPEFVNEPMLINKDGSLKRLEQVPYQSYEESVSGEVAEDGSPALSRIIFDGPNSSIRIDKNAKFIIKVTDAEIDPETLFFLARVDTDRKHRIALAHLSSAYQKDVMGFKLDIKKIAPGVYILTPQRTLEGEAEYAFVVNRPGSNKVQCFLFGIN